MTSARPAVHRPSVTRRAGRVSGGAGPRAPRTGRVPRGAEPGRPRVGFGPRRADPGSRRGTSFAELAIATLFLALAMVPLMDSVIQGQRRVEADRMRVIAGALAANALERYRLESPAAVGGAIGGVATDEALMPGDAPEAWAELTSRFTVTPTFDGGAPGVLTVEVTWEEGGAARRVEMATVLAPTFAPTGGP